MGLVISGRVYFWEGRIMQGILHFQMAIYIIIIQKSMGGAYLYKDFCV